MPEIQYFNYPGWGEHAEKDLNYSQVVRIGNELRISGQGGWREGDFAIPDSEEEQIEIAFDNIERALKHAGLKEPFKNIFSIRSLHVNNHYETAAIFSRIAKERFGENKPIWTLIGVERLGLETMKVEIEVCAVVDDGM